ncbi:hypothetical protein EMA8858_00890 [Emticicia aquatica]|uniref:Uncharacterized protein n=2 Tax=Emticicia aquatica TaxID=1681835 RepID=A0ABM9ALW0_9BACT|nr:hypothetical protein EMA8858_00890 [Emticicia aquatica]
MLTDEQIFDILDGFATEEVREQHNYLLANSTEYQKYFNELETLHFDLAELPILQPSTEFTQNVLANISYETAKKKSWSEKLVLIFISLMVISLSLTFILILFYVPASTIKIDVPQQWFEMTKTFLTDTLVKVLLLVNLIVLLVIFDKKVLKPYFSQRRMTLS